nr:MAG TPA: hypothetical protein [Caudoviricetes sp.]
MLRNNLVTFFVLKVKKGQTRMVILICENA